jgi:drug/metabolite transporter (DMT)-like permease
MMAGTLALIAYVLAGLTAMDLVGLDAVPVSSIGAIAAAGALAMTTFLLITFAFSKVEASLLAPFQYLEIVGATVVGLLIFSEVPDAMTLFGTTIILASGAYVFHRERVRKVDSLAAQSVER